MPHQGHCHIACPAADVQHRRIGISQNRLEPPCSLPPPKPVYIGGEHMIQQVVPWRNLVEHLTHRPRSPCFILRTRRPGTRHAHRIPISPLAPPTRRGPRSRSRHLGNQEAASNPANAADSPSSPQPAPACTPPPLRAPPRSRLPQRPHRQFPPGGQTVSLRPHSSCRRP